jgi:hypothetical protein
MRNTAKRYYVLSSLAQETGDPYSTAMPEALEAMREDTGKQIAGGVLSMGGATALWQQITTLTGKEVTKDNGSYGVKRVGDEKVVMRHLAPSEVQVLPGGDKLVETIDIERTPKGGFYTKVSFNAFRRTVSSDFEPLPDHPVEKVVLSTEFNPDSGSQLDGLHTFEALKQVVVAAAALRTSRS